MIQCEGYVRTGGAFSLGPVRWVQCENEAKVNIRLIQDGKEETLPGCNDCWQRAIEWKGIKIISVEPIKED